MLNVLPIRKFSISNNFYIPLILFKKNFLSDKRTLRLILHIRKSYIKFYIYQLQIRGFSLKRLFMKPVNLIISTLITLQFIISKLTF